MLIHCSVLSNDGNTHTPVPYGISAASVTPSPTDSTSSSTLFTYTDVPRPLMTTVSPNDSQYGSSNNVPIFPVIFGVLGGVSFLTFILACVFLVRRRSMHKNIPLVSDAEPPSRGITCLISYSQARIRMNIDHDLSKFLMAASPDPTCRP